MTFNLNVQDADSHDLIQLMKHIGNRGSSTILSHGARCCIESAEWFQAIARGKAEVGSPPTWIRDRWKWGPQSWPIYWCEAVATKTLDCGALAALATVALQESQLNAIPVQLLERFDESTTTNWKADWQDIVGVAKWFGRIHAFHEAVGIVKGKEVKIWDPTDNVWVDSKPFYGYGSIAAARLPPPKEGNDCPEIIWRNSISLRSSWVIFGD